MASDGLRPFSFEGKPPLSKSLLNRSLVLRSYAQTDATFFADSDAEDVRVCAQALRAILDGKEAWCGSAGTALRFCALRAARLPGVHHLAGRRRLFERPQQGLLRLLEDLGVKARIEEHAGDPQARVLRIESRGWQAPAGPLHVAAEGSSQFLSALLLNAWDLDFPLEVAAPGLVSASYAQMTLQLCRRSGMTIEQSAPEGWRVPVRQVLRQKPGAAEIDLSSAFAIAAVAAVAGRAVFKDFPESSLQGDARFVEILTSMGVTVSAELGTRRFARVETIKPWSGDLSDAPDLFPVLAVLCGLADGESRITGLQALKDKESDRLARSRLLLQLLGRESSGDASSFIIHGRPPKQGFGAPFEWDPDQDHRMAFAAAVALWAGAPLRVLHPEVVEKSYPCFWEDAGLRAHTTALIGHRGTGKTTLLAALPGEVVDLDAQIEKRSGMSVLQIFKQEGEAAFRVLETGELEAQLAPRVGAGPGPRFLALGAGATLAPLAGGPTLWIRRESDVDGRILDARPVWREGESPLEAFRERYPLREALYQEAAWETLTLPEGSEVSESLRRLARDFVAGETLQIGGALTLLPENFASAARWRRFAAKRAKWGLDWLEVRDDLLGPEVLPRVLEFFPAEKLLLSRRRRDSWLLGVDAELTARALVDWDLAYTEDPPTSRFVRSLHDRLPGETLEAALLRLEAGELSHAILKAAPIVHTWDELRVGHEWQARDPDRRSFLPRSAAGAPSWSWYRLVRKGRQALNFFREGSGSAPDQPYWLPWALVPRSIDFFGAVLGSPVVRSRSPSEHADDFAARGEAFVAIDLPESEFTAERLSFLSQLGLRACAVTAPLKRRAWELASDRTPLCDELGSANTLRLSVAGCSAANTDLEGFRELWSGLANPGATLVWGGGGTLPVLQRELPGASFYSVRSAAPREGSRPMTSPRTLLWAAGPDAPEPPAFAQNPTTIVDLSYRGDSAARVYASRMGAQYVPGLVMFRRQAALQRRFWGS
jgi:3-phosphoshikimate 1-carboxyvinyltransferase